MIFLSCKINSVWHWETWYAIILQIVITAWNRYKLPPPEDNTCISASLQGGKIQMYAIIETGGKQYRVEEGDILKIRKAGYTWRRNSWIRQSTCLVKGRQFSVGQPFLENTKVVGKVLEHGKEKKNNSL